MNKVSYKRFFALCEVVGLPAPGTVKAEKLIEIIEKRLLIKSERLSQEVEGLSFEGARDAVAAACQSIHWERLTRAYGAIRNQQYLVNGAWDVISSLPATFEPKPEDIPLNAMRRIIIREFASGMQAALRLEAPAAHDLTARLYGVPDWFTLTGPRVVMCPATPLYQYRERATVDGTVAFLEPSSAALIAEEEIEAETALWNADRRADIAMHHLAHRADLLAAGAIACSSAIEAGRYEQALFCANRVIQAMKPVLPAELAPLSMRSRSNLYWREVLGAWVAAVRKLGPVAEASRRQQRYVFRALERFDATRNVRENGSPATPLAHRSMFKVVAVM
ncbi:hypothetical protein [Caballeronia sp. Lep1P3]|uniref:hypothetical protein n=1 Tax=Caballeronia sp. Lep1P3 TaxID=2878150 RepID=UPI001FD43C4E|nr:hypothetical protein [Caballeronia sp. Lep1P3]